MKHSLCVLILLSHFSFSQDNKLLQSDSSRAQTSKESITDFGFGRLTSNSALPAVQISDHQFNSGNVSDPLQLIQGKVSGLLITKAGNDPHEPFNARIRGINSIYLSNSPLIIIDGMPFSSMLNLDPFDISKITVIKDAATASQFGLNSQNGIILIETHTGKNKKLSFRHYTALETSEGQSSAAMNSNEYLRAGGSDLGNRIDWEKEITRNSFSNVTNISYGDKNGGTEYYASFNYRNVNGVLENSGFRNYNGRAKISQSFFKEKLVMAAQFSMTHRKNSFSFPEAFKYAKTFIPTSPLFNNDRYAEYILYDNFNPAAMLHQNISDGATKTNRLGINLSYKPVSSLEVKAGFYNEEQKNSIRKYWSKTSNWMGAFENGHREQQMQGLLTNFAFLSADYSKTISKTSITINGNASMQKLYFSEDFLYAVDFQTDVEGAAEITDFDTFTSGKVRTRNNFANTNEIKSYRTSFSSNTNNQFFINANICNEVLSNNLKGNTYGLALAFDWATRNQKIFSMFKTEIGYGKTAGGMSFFQNYNSRNLIQSWRSVIFDNVKPERKSEITAGIDWAIKNISGSVNFFKANIKDVLMYNYITNPDGTFTPVLVNQAQIRNTGVEIDLRWEIIRAQNFQLSTSINYSTINNTFLTNKSPFYFQPTESIIAHGATNLFALENNKPVGLNYGLHYQGIADNQWVFLDKDKNGSIGFEDYTTFGRPLPVSFLGWTTQIKSGRWSANVLFRGAFGHTVFNTTRLAYERTDFIQGYNAPPSILRPPFNTMQTAGWASDYYLENASYFKLDNLGVSYDLFRRSPDRDFTCTLNLAVQNLFTITNYSGTSPEIRLDYFGTQYAAGYDSQFTYSSSRTFLLGVYLNL